MRLIKGLVWAKRLEDEQGAALVELALCLFMLLILVFGLIDFSQIILDHQMMVGIARQGSDIASRAGEDTPEGEDPLVVAVQGLVVQGAPMNIGTKGRIILTEVRDINGQPQIEDQAESTTGITVTSAVGTGIGNPATMPASASTALNAGQTLFVTEVFYSYSPMTPISGFLKTSLTSTLYESAYF